MDRSDGIPLKGENIIVSYIDHVENDRGHYFHLKTGEWIPGDGERIWPQYSYQFQGLLFKTTPRLPFGWALFDAEVHRQPNYNTYANPIIRQLDRYEIVQVYAIQTVDGNEWVQISPDEWTPARFVGVVFPDPTPPAGVTGDRWIDVNLAEQTLAVYENRKLVFATLIATGQDPYWTRPGLFQIYLKKESEDMSGAFTADKSDYYLLQSVPWTMYFDKARALHGAYWRAGFGYPQSHGCVNLSVGDANWLFQWANEGDWVYVHDPSGATPTDPIYYGDGGA
jgi:lipoprotein-anchoring transpeptidase ErfK/SrfK